jgi:hypothetical protein
MPLSTPAFNYRIPHHHGLLQMMCTPSHTVVQLALHNMGGETSARSGQNLSFHFSRVVQDVTIKGLVESPA